VLEANICRSLSISCPVDFLRTLSVRHWQRFITAKHFRTFSRKAQNRLAAFMNYFISLS
jgi:hypothetical protein